MNIDSLLSNPYYPRYVYVSVFHRTEQECSKQTESFYLACPRTPILTRKMYVYICKLYMFLCFMSFYLFFRSHNLTLASFCLPVLFFLALPLNAFSAMQGNCSILTLNVRGLRSQLKRRSIFSYLKDQNCHFYFLQEIYSEPNNKKIWRSEWGGE